MEKTMAPLTGVARAKYVRDFTCKINQSDKFADIFATKILTKSRKLLDSKSATKKKRKSEPKISVKLQKKDLNHEYIVQRMKFLRQSIETVNEAVNRTAKKSTIQPPPVIRFASKFEQFKNKSFEVEKRKLNELYKAEMQNINSTMEPIEEPNAEIQSKSPIPKPHPDQPDPQPVEEILKPSLVQALINNPISGMILRDLHPDDGNQSTCRLEFQHRSEDEPEQSQIQELGEIIEPSEPIVDQARDTNDDNTIQLCQNQLQNINLDSSTSNALAPSNNITTNRRICHRNKRFKRYLMKPFCAHCRDLITEVAFFSGTQQLCIECADRHYDRVSRARYRDRPMGYKEFKNIGGDTIYNKS